MRASYCPFGTIYYFILRHVLMIGTRRQVQREGKMPWRPEDARPMSRKHGREGERGAGRSRPELPPLMAGTSAPPELPPPRTGTSAQMPPRCLPAPREMDQAGTSAPRDRNFRPLGTSAQVPPKFRNYAETPLDVTARKLAIYGTWPELGRNFRPDRNFRPRRPELPPMTGTSAQDGRNFRPTELQYNSTFQRVTYPFAPTYK